jgi:hypothetical protein
MKKFIIALILIILPQTTLAQTTNSVANYPVGTCRQIEGKTGFYQQLSDGTWAPPGDRLNTCNMSNLYGQNGYGQFGQNTLGQMTYQQWFMNCMMTQSFAPRPECQGISALLMSMNGGLNNSPWNYPQLGRDYIAIQSGNVGVSIDLTDSGNSGNRWTNILMGVGLGWILNQVTS